MAGSLAYSQTITPISDLKSNDASGIPINNGKTFTVTGIVTSSNQFGNSGPGSIQDETAGISVYGSEFVNKVNIGDSVIVTATVSQYGGLEELNFSTSSSVTVISSNHNVDPEIVTIIDISSQEWNGFEALEGKLIRINNVTINGAGNFSGGTSGYNYDITDSTGTLSQGIRIDNNATSIVGTSIPSGKVDIIGILQQYKSAAPYNSGYQLLPRFIQDIVTNGEPAILSPVFASDIDTSSFTVYYNTARNGNAAIKYGLTSSLEIDSIGIDEDTTYHKIKLTGLKPASLYYYKVYSSNENGVSISALQTAATSSSDTTTGTINVYFNYPVDTTLALPGNAAHGNIIFSDKLVNRINRATYSIDMAVYSFADMPDVANALILAKKRGVKIRVVYDSRTVQNSMQALINEGILVSQRPASLDGIMHNKFFIFDARDTMASNDWLWTGSWNVTLTELSWKNNVIEINDPSITKAYQKEFEEMWGSTTDTPNTSAAKFGSQKSDNTPHYFSIKGRSIYVYFSPSDGTTSKIISAINTANHDFYLAMYTITRNDIGSEISSIFNNGVKDVKGVVNNINDNGSEYTFLSGFADMHPNPGNVLHDKYALIDAMDLSSDPIVITGSHNWTSAAETSNDENTLIIHDSLIANLYVQDFKQRYNDAGGTGAFTAPTGITDKGSTIITYNLNQNYPNPFNPSTNISYSLPKESYVTVKVFDILGREVKTLVDGYKSAGQYNVSFDASKFTSGVYFYQLKTGNLLFTKKMMLLK